MILKMQSSENWSVWCGFLHQQSSRIWWCFGLSLLSCPAPRSAFHWCWCFPGSRRAFPASPVRLPGSGKRFPAHGGQGGTRSPSPVPKGHLESKAPELEKPD